LTQFQLIKNEPRNQKFGYLKAMERKELQLLQIRDLQTIFDEKLYFNQIEDDIRPTKTSLPIAIDLATTQCQLAFLKESTNQMECLKFNNERFHCCFHLHFRSLPSVMLLLHHTVFGFSVMYGETALKEYSANPECGILLRWAKRWRGNTYRTYANNV
jgi:hypothetical protein